MKKVNESNNKKKKDLIVRLCSIVAILIVIAIAYNFIKNLQTVKFSTGEYKLFQYVMGSKNEYSVIVEMSNKKDITKLETKEGTIYLTSIPVYFLENRDKAILPAEMEIAFPIESGKLNKVGSLATVYIDFGDVYIKKGDVNKKLENTFLYDGNDLYFFVENTVVTVNGEEYKLPPLSYVNATYKGYVEIYNYDTDEYIYVEDVDGDVIAQADAYQINLSDDKLKCEDTEQLLIRRIKDLPNLE